RHSGSDVRRVRARPGSFRFLLIFVNVAGWTEAIPAAHGRPRAALAPVPISGCGSTRARRISWRCDEYSECRDPEGKRRLQEGGCPCGADAGEIEPEPGRRARLVHQVLDTRRCPFAQQLTVAFKPGQKGDDLVEFGEAEAGEPAEGKEKCDGANSSIDLPAERYGQQQERGEPKTAQRDRCHARIELNLLPLTGSIESNDIMTIES